MSKSSAPSQPAPVKSKACRTGSKVSGHAAPSSGKNRRPATGSKSLKAKEEEYRKLNAELEAKTAELVREAEHLVKGNLSLLCDLESSTELPSHTPPTQHITHITTSPTPPPSQPSQSHSHTPHTHQHSEVTTWLPATGVVVETDSVGAAVDEVVSRAERELDLPEWNQDPKVSAGSKPMSNYHGNDIVPETADDMGPEALTRFLKAKLRVMQEEIDRLCQELTTKEKQLSLKDSKVKELSDLNTKLQRTHHSIQPELEKYKKLSESLKQKCGGLESQLTALRKEVEVMKGGERKACSKQGAVEVRLNRALEEVERYKTQLGNLQAHSEDVSKSERVKVEKLTHENKQLLKQRNELMTAFKKQLKLIDILKRQKMHIEAAKMLSFTEEEFMKALDWQTT